MNSIPILDLSKGLKLNTSNALIEPGYTSDCKNVQVNLSEVYKRNGFSLFTSQSLNGDVIAFKYWKKLTGEKYLICFTTKDAYKWTPSTKLWELITPIYSTGTVSMTAGSPTVTGVGTVWTTNVKAGQIFKSTDGIEYTILTVNTDTSLTLTANYSATVSGVSYTIRQLFFSNADTNYSFAEMTNKLFIANGENILMKWEGTGNIVYVSNAYQSKFVVEFENHLLLLNTYESGYWCPQRVRRSDAGNPEVWSGGDAGFVDLVENSDYITGVSKSNSVLKIYKENSITLSRWLGYPSLYSYDENVIVGVGLSTVRTLQSWRDSDYFLYKDGVYTLEFASKISLISENVNKAIIDSITPEYFGRCISFINYEDNTYWLITPYNKVIWIYSLVNKTWVRGDTIDITGVGNYVEDFDITFDELIGTFDEQNWIYDSVSQAKLNPIVLLGIKNYVSKYNLSVYKDYINSYTTISQLLYSTNTPFSYSNIKANLFKPTVDCSLVLVKFRLNSVNSSTDLKLHLFEVYNVGTPSIGISTSLANVAKPRSSLIVGWNTVNIDYELKANQYYAIGFQGQEPLGLDYEINCNNFYPNTQQYYMFAIEYFSTTNSYRIVGQYYYYMFTFEIYVNDVQSINSYWTTHNLIADANYLKINNSWMKLRFEAKGNKVGIYYSIDGGITWIFKEDKTLTSNYASYYTCLRVTSPSIMFKFVNNDGWFNLKWVDVDYIKRGGK